jgi:hypothetical protein
MAGVAPVIPKVQFTSPTGVPLVDGTVTVYLAGTTTPTSTWQDQALTTLNTNPILLDSRGEATVWLDPSLSYKFILATAGGAEQWTVDNISGASGSYTLSGSGGSALVGFIQAGVGAVLRTMQDKARDYVSIKDFGAVGNGTTDDTAAILATIASGAKNIYAPPGTYLVTSTISLSTTRDLTFWGAGRDATAFVTNISDGSPVFTISGQWNDIADFKINSNDGTQKNFLGLKAGDAGAGTSFTRSRIRIKVSNAATGVDVRGWVNDLDVFVTLCTTLGFKGKEVNSCTMNLRLENNIKDLDIETCYGSTITNLLAENTFTAATAIQTSTIDDFQGLTINSIYIEGGSHSTTALTFGDATASKNLTIGNIQSTVVPLDKTSPIIVDRVSGVNITGNVGAGGFNATVSFTANASGILPQIVALPGTSSSANSTMRLQDNSKQIRRALNYFGDTLLNHYLSTFDVVTKTGVTVTQETTNVYNGRKGIKIEANTGGASRVLGLGRRVSTFPGVANLVGKTLKMFALVYVPSLAKYEDRTYTPAFEVSVSGSGSAFSAAQRTLVPGTWNLVETPSITVPGGWLGTGADKVEVAFYANNNGTSVSDAGYYILVDSVWLCDGTVSLLDIMRGNWTDYNLLGIESDGSNMSLKSSTYHTLTLADANTALGDVITNPAVSATSPVKEWVCTVAGSGGVGTWRPSGATAGKGVTASRPTLTASDVGVCYFDTTLDADGKPIWWTGTAWVDATGATV